MNPIDPPSPDSRLTIQFRGLPIRLWWKLMETAQKQKVPLSYLIFHTLAKAVDYGLEGDSYDLVVSEIKDKLDQEA